MLLDDFFNYREKVMAREQPCTWILTPYANAEHTLDASLPHHRNLPRFEVDRPHSRQRLASARHSICTTRRRACAQRNLPRRSCTRTSPSTLLQSGMTVERAIHGLHPPPIPAPPVLIIAPHRSFSTSWLRQRMLPKSKHVRLHPQRPTIRSPLGSLWRQP
jgi:hypothetical protein